MLLANQQSTGKKKKKMIALMVSDYRDQITLLMLKQQWRASWQAAIEWWTISWHFEDKISQNKSKLRDAWSIQLMYSQQNTKKTPK